jgi:hypothetical protein
VIGSLKIGYRYFTVESEESTDSHDGGHDAFVNHRTGQIKVSSDQLPDRVVFLLVHEVLHALARDAAIDWTKDDEEIFVERMTPRLTAFLADNPDQVRQMLDMLEVGP